MARPKLEFYDAERLRVLQAQIRDEADKIDKIIDRIGDRRIACAYQKSLFEALINLNRFVSDTSQKLDQAIFEEQYSPSE